MNRNRKSWIGYVGFYGLNVFIIIGIFTLESRVTSPINKTELQYNWRLFENGACFPKKLSYVSDRNVNRSRIALASFPGSGNTWMRHLIQQSTGYYTGSVYNDSNLSTNGFMGESAKITDVKRQCIVYKTHKDDTDTIKQFKKAIILIRNPLHVLKATFHYRYIYRAKKRQKKMQNPMNKTTKSDPVYNKTFPLSRQSLDKHTDIAPPSAFNSSEFSSFAERQLSEWKTRNIFWLKNYRGRSRVVLYENLKNDLSAEVMKIATFLDVQVQPEDISCTVKNKEGNFHRNGTKSGEVDLLNILNEKQKMMIRDVVCQVHQVMKSLRLTLDLDQYLIDISGSGHANTCKQVSFRDVNLNRRKANKNNKTRSRKKSSRI